MDLKRDYLVQVMNEKERCFVFATGYKAEC